jgi:hypothetical protein
VLPVVALAVIRHAGVPVFGAPLEKDDLHRFTGELEKANSGRGTREPGPDDENSAPRVDVVHRCFSSFPAADTDILP